MLTNAQKKELLSALNQYLDSPKLLRQAVFEARQIESELTYDELCQLNQNSPYFRISEHRLCYLNGRPVGDFSHTIDSLFPIYMKVIYDALFYVIPRDFLKKNYQYLYVIKGDEEEINQKNKEKKAKLSEINEFLVQEIKKNHSQFDLRYQPARMNIVLDYKEGTPASEKLKFIDEDGKSSLTAKELVSYLANAKNIQAIRIKNPSDSVSLGDAHLDEFFVEWSSDEEFEWFNESLNQFKQSGNMQIVMDEVSFTYPISKKHLGNHENTIPHQSKLGFFKHPEKSNSRVQNYLFAGLAICAVLLITGACISNPILIIAASIALLVNLIALINHGVHEPKYMRLI